MVYLIHFSSKLHHASHYLGSCSNLKRRIARHRANDGAKLLRALNLAGIGWRVVRVWAGGRELERRMKRRRCSPAYCPICNPKQAKHMIRRHVG